MKVIQGLDNPLLNEVFGDQAAELRDEIELVKGASHEFDSDAYLKGRLTPVFFGSAINNFGVTELLDDFVATAPSPGRARRARGARKRRFFGIRLQDPGEHGPGPP